MILDDHNPEQFPDRVAILVPVDGQDVDFGPTETVPAAITYPIHCYISTSDATAGYSSDAEIGTTRARFFFPTRPAVVKGHRLEREVDGRQFRVLAPPEPRDGVLFLVNCQVID